MKEALTKRENEILNYIVRGFTNEQIAGEIYISKDTVKAHTKEIYRKLDAKNRVQAVISAIKNNIVALK